VCVLLDAVGETGLLVHGLGDGNVDFLSVVKVCADFVAEFAFGELDIVLGGAFAGHQVEETIVNVNLLISFRRKLESTNWYSVRTTLGTSMLWVEGQRSSNFFWVKIYD
jgi:hypothetical protein